MFVWKFCLVWSNRLWNILILFQKKPKQPWGLCQISLIISWNHCGFARKVVKLLFVNLWPTAWQQNGSINEIILSLPNELRKLKEKFSFCALKPFVLACCRAIYWGMKGFLLQGKCLFQSHLYYRSLSPLVPILCISIKIWAMPHECNICQHLSKSC